MMLGVIPARGGSKGIPRKNLSLVGDDSLLAHAIKSALSSDSLDYCLVSTEDSEIAEHASRLGANVPFLRPRKFAEDTTPTWQVLIHAIEWYEQSTARTVDAVVTLQPTTPFRTGADIDACVALFIKAQPEAKCVISVCEDKARHPLTLYSSDLDHEGYLRPLLSGLDPNTRRQDFSSVFWRNGAVYITRRDLLIEQKRVTSDNPLGYVMPVDRSINIDSFFDLHVAELLWRKRKLS